MKMILTLFGVYRRCVLNGLWTSQWWLYCAELHNYRCREPLVQCIKHRFVFQIIELSKKELIFEKKIKS